MSSSKKPRQTKRQAATAETKRTTRTRTPSTKRPKPASVDVKKPIGAGREVKRTGRDAEVGVPAQQQISAVFTWTGVHSARLHFLTDNNVVVKDETHHLTGTGRLVADYAADTSASHNLEWSLRFPGSKLEDLQATISVDGGEEKKLNSSDSETNVWAEKGEWP